MAQNSEHSDELIKNVIATQEKVDPNVISFHPTCHTREEAWRYFLNNNFLLDNNTVGKAIAKKVKERIDEKGEVPDSVKVYVNVSVEFQIDKEMISPIRERGRPWYWYIDSNSVLATAAGGALVGNALGSGAGAVIGAVIGGFIGAVARKS
ncbi:hypothetical protein HYR99_18505 [Candidatus Poribacteria bacterium]|nr:hypothetical protein [Candidatus Poribacteria bacterium]